MSQEAAKGSTDWGGKDSLHLPAEKIGNDLSQQGVAGDCEKYKLKPNAGAQKEEKNVS